MILSLKYLHVHKHTFVSTVPKTSCIFLVCKRKGIIYPVRYRELDFTVPEFDGFIKRLEEYQTWDEKKKKTQLNTGFCQRICHSSNDL